MLDVPGAPKPWVAIRGHITCMGRVQGSPESGLWWEQGPRGWESDPGKSLWFFHIQEGGQRILVWVKVENEGRFGKETENAMEEWSISVDITYMWNLKKMIQMNLFTKETETHRLRKQTYGYQREKRCRGVGFGINRYTLQYINR